MTVVVFFIWQPYDNMRPAVCRICLKSGANRALFGSETVPINHMMIEVFRFDIPAAPGDGLPAKICKRCFMKLTSAYKLKRLAERSYTLLMGLKKPVKNEDSLDQKMNIKNEFELDTGMEHKKTGRPNNKDNNYVDIEYHEIKEEMYNESDNDTCPDLNKENLSIENSNIENEDTLAKSELEEKDRKLKICDLCGKPVAKLNEHMKLHNKNRKRIPCTFCPKTFATYGARKKHVSVHHLGLLYYCEICKKHYKRGNEHRRLQHSGLPNQYECMLCKKKFRTNTQLKTHMSSHTREKPFSCSQCGKAFRSKASCNYHRRRVHDGEKEVICQYCSKAFFSAQHLKVHLRTHTKEKNYKCKECDKSFSTSSGLRTHERRHTGVKDFQCSLCDMSFVNTGALSSHMVSHTKEKKYECKYCGVKFGRSDHRNRHQKTAHEKVVEANPFISSGI